MIRYIFVACLLCLFAKAMSQSDWHIVPGRITTPWAEQVDPSHPLPEYPRPQMVRGEWEKQGEWENLNGLWEYAIVPKDQDEPVSYQGKILVPFAIESALSGVGRTVGKDSTLWYRTSFAVPPAARGMADLRQPGTKKNATILLHFGAVDWRTEVFVNGKSAGIHEGGYDPFTFDITSLIIKGRRQRLAVKVWDPTDEGPQPRGKQVKHPDGIWYTSVTGIWQTVWIEAVPATYIAALRQTPDIDRQTLSVSTDVRGLSAGDSVRLTAWDGARMVARVAAEAGPDGGARADAAIPASADATGGNGLFTRMTQVLSLPGAKLWSPDSPFLYDLTVSVVRWGKVIDEVKSYFAMRKISVTPDAHGIMRMMLNNQFVFEIGPLDQGWWPDGLYTAPTDEALRSDIQQTKNMGFNMIRKHVKVEPARWYHDCDEIGMLVWQDMPSGDLGARWNPNPGLEGGNEMVRTSESEAIYRKEWNAIMNGLYNFPCIVVWTPFNEAWGQFKTVDITEWTMKNDPSRLVNSASGGNYYETGQIMDLHHYPDPAMAKADVFGTKQALVLGEFGGLGLPLDGHTWQAKNNWGYRTFANPDTLFQIYSSFINALQPLIQKGLSAAVYTQTTDVEVETNGLITYDRKVIKMPADRLKALHAQLNAAANCCGGMAAGEAPHDPLPASTPQWRPVYHYTPRKNWTNDPNGLIYLNGEYLLYNQYNPFDYKWGHMSWGHAVSKDLVDWKELPVAIPEIMGTDTTLRFSGSAVWDKNNSSGFCTSPKGCLVAIYTADQPALKRESQFIAYSNDGGISYTNYAGNPVVDLHMRDFRDPNVIWMEKDQRWLMTVALPNEHKVRFYGSHDLKRWELLSEFSGDQGDRRNIWECPSLTPLTVDGDSSRVKWLLMVSSGNPDAQTGMQYFIGDFDGKTFANNNPADLKMFVDDGSTFYAAIPWNNLPPGQHLLTGWLVPGSTPTYPWTGQMSIPRDLSLRTTADGIRLFQEPAEMISRTLGRLSHGRVTRRTDLAVGDAGIDLGAAAHLTANAYWVKAELRVGGARAGGFRIASKQDAAGNVVEGTVIGYDATTHRLYIDKTHSGGQPNGYDSIVHYIPVKPVNGVLRLEILVDNSSLEVFAGDGAGVYTTMVYPGPGADGLSLFAKGGDFRVKELTIWNLEK